MKRKIFYSLLLGFVLLIISLFYRTGASKLEPMPYIGGTCGSPGGVCGVIAVPQGGLTASTSLAKRGFPLPAVSISADEDRPSNYYKSLNLLNVVIDWAIYSAIVFLLITLFSRLKPDAKK